MGWPVDKERKGCESSIHDHNIDFCVTMIECVDVPDSDWGDFRHRRAVDISSCFIYACIQMGDWKLCLVLGLRIYNYILNVHIVCMEIRNTTIDLLLYSIYRGQYDFFY